MTALPRASRILSIFNAPTRRWVPIPSGLPTIHHACTQHTVVPTLSLSTWNIDAFSPRPVARASAIVNQLLTCPSAASDVIFLQEVTRDVRDHLLRDARIRAGFLTTDAEDETAFDDVPFATMTLLSKACFTSCTTRDDALLGPVTRVKFPSRYGRDALCTDVFLPPSSLDQPLSIRSPFPTQSESWRRLRLVNVHLDSLGSTLHYRKEQMGILASLLRENNNNQEQELPGVGLAAGDFNAINPEDQDLVTKNLLLDAWVQLHGEDAGKSEGLTWGDAKEKRRDGLRPGRLDKIAMTEGLEPITMHILCPGTIPLPKPGKEKDDEIRWSDHAGLRCMFRIC